MSVNWAVGGRIPIYANSDMTISVEISSDTRIVWDFPSSRRFLRFHVFSTLLNIATLIQCTNVCNIFKLVRYTRHDLGWVVTLIQLWSNYCTTWAVSVNYLAMGNLWHDLGFFAKLICDGRQMKPKISALPTFRVDNELVHVQRYYMGERNSGDTTN